MHDASAMAYDPARNQVVLFGGSTTTAAANATAQTWVWAAGNWTHLAPAASPSARMDAGMVWDPAISKLVMFGGINTAGTDLPDTWTWDGATWAQLTPTTSPSARDSAPMSWDPDLNEIVMFGGQTSLGVFTNDTWTFANNTWTQYQAAGVSGAPLYRAASGMAYSYATTPGQLLMFGGLERSCPTCSVTRGNDTWIFTASGWTLQTPANVPPGRGEFGMAYDGGLGAVIITSGEDSSGAALSDTWAWNGSTWIQAQAGITTEPWYFNPGLAITNSGQAVWQVGPASGTGNPQTWVYDTSVPILSASISTPANGQSTFFVGDTATISLTAQNTSTSAITTTITGLLPTDLNAGGATLAWNGAALQVCTTLVTVNCGTSQEPTFTQVQVGASQTASGSFLAQIIGNTRGCNNVSIPISANDIYGGQTIATTSTTVCGGGLGSERWWTYDTTQLGVGGTAAVNTANGNLLVKQTDTTPIQSHGALAFELGRAYNSQDNMNPNLLGSNPLGAGWQWDTSTAGTGPAGLDIGSLIAPTLPTSGSPSVLNQALSVTYVDRDGTRDVFTLRSLSATVPGASLLLGLVPNLTLSVTGQNTDTLCADAAYQAPPGVDMSLYRYVGVSGNSCGGSATAHQVLGWAVVRPDRLRYDYDINGRLVDVVDPAGNELLYNYTGSNLSSITSTRCNGGAYNANDACPKYSFAYPQVVVGPSGSQITYQLTRVTDPAGRVTTYVTRPAAGGNPAELIQVWNPDNPFTTPSGAAGFVGTPSISYTYSAVGNPCTIHNGTTITVGALCSVTDAAGGTTTFGYTPAPLGSDRILSVTDRRANATGGQSSTNGTETVYSYTNAADGYSTATVSADTAAPATLGGGNTPPITGCPSGGNCERNNYTGIDQYGRVGEVDQGAPTSGTNGSWLHQEAFFWDGNIVVNGVPFGCNGPSVARDNELCETNTRATPSSTAFGPVTQYAVPTGTSTSDHVMVYNHNELGLLVGVGKVIDPTKKLTTDNTMGTSYGNHLQYVESDGTVHAFNDRVIGHGNVDLQTDAATGSYYNTVMGDSPSAFYRFNNLTGTTAADSTPNHQDANENLAPGTLLGQVGPAASTAVGEGGNGVWAGYVPALTKFANGTGPSSAFSVETWVKTTNSGTDYTVCAPCDGTGVVAGRAPGGHPFLYLSGTTSGHVIQIVDPNTVADGNWHQVDYTYNGSGLASGANIYVDGVAINTGPPTYDTLGASTPFRTDGTIAYYGDNTTSTGPDGTALSDLSLYNTALPATQVAKDYSAFAHLFRYDPGTLYGVGDRTQMLTPRGNTATNWGDYLTAYRRDEPQNGGSGYPLMNATSGNVCTPGSNPQDTGLLCETDSPASAGVSAGVCQNPNTAGSGVPGGGPTDSSLSYSCTRADYYGGTGTDQGSGPANGQDLASAAGQKRESWNGFADATSPAGASTVYRYAQDGSSCTSSTPCDLSGYVSAGGWLTSVIDPTGNFVAYAYDRAGNTARTWDRNATSHAVTNNWSTANNEPSQSFTESDHTNPVTSNDLSVSAYDSEVITPQGVVSGSGDNSNGQLGNGTTTTPPGQVLAGNGLHDVVQIGQTSLGGAVPVKGTYALTGSGTVYQWGQPVGTTNTVTIPTPVAGLPTNITAISVGGNHVLALDRTGALWAWGSNAYGEVGAGGSGTVAPTKVLTGVATFSAGAFHSTAVTTDGRLWAWGLNNAGQIGNGNTGTNPSTPVVIAGMTHVVSVSAGYVNTYAIKADGTVWAWGDNTYGNLGTGSAQTTFNTPQQVTALGSGPNVSGSRGAVRQIAASAYGAAALLEDGSVWGWGLNNTGQLPGNSGNSPVPVQILAPTSHTVALVGGWATYLAANEAGEVRIWGATNAGQIGDGLTPPAQVPVQLSGYSVSPFAFPWRYATESRDQLGNRVTTTVDADGMPVTVRSARGNDVFSTTYDTYNSYDAGNLLTTTQAPVERGGAGGVLGGPGVPSVATPTTYSYDAYGNKTVVVDPNGFATLTDYDLANRAFDVKTSRQVSATDSGACSISFTGTGWTSAQQNNRKMCTTSTVFDGADQATSVTDANGQTSYATYNALGEKTAQTTPRNDGIYLNANLATVTVYDADGNVTDVCPPRQFDGHNNDWLTTTVGSCPANAAYGTHLVIDNAGRTASSTVYRVSGTSAANAQATPETTPTSYDADGNPTSVTDANGHTRTTAYNILDRKISQTVPRSAGVSFTTSWTYDPSGDVTAVNAPSANNYGDGTNGALVVDGGNNPQSNPFVIPTGARYTTVTLQNGGWITGQNSAASSGAMGLVFSATGAVTICSNCGITQVGNGQTGGSGNNQGLGNASGSAGQVVGGNGGGAGTGSTSGGGGGGGGHNGPGTVGVGGGLLQGNGGAGGLASGSSDFSDVGTNYTLAAGGGGGGAAQGLNATASSAGGNGGGFIHISAPTITINGTFTAAGANGASSSGVNGGSGGGAGGGVWLTSDTINLSGTNDLNVAGGTGGVTNSSGGNGGAGAPGYVRIDGTVTGANPPAGTTTRSSGMVTAYSYDVDHRVLDTVTGFQGTNADPAIDHGSDAIPDTAGQINRRTRVGYDADGHKVITFNPRAFTDVASLTTTLNLDYTARTDYDADSRPVAAYSPRYDTANPDVADVASGGDGGTSTDQQTAQCATGADPSIAPGYGTYPTTTTGVCVARNTYDADGNVARQYLPTSTGSDNRYTAYTYTDDNLKLTLTTPDPANAGGRATAATNVYDAVGRVVQSTDANNAVTRTTYTPNGLVKETDGQSAGSVTHVVENTYDANGIQITTSTPNAVTAPGGTPNPDDVTTTTWTSDGLKASIKAPGTGSGSFDTTMYGYDAVGNATSVLSPSGVAKDATTNSAGLGSINTFTWDNLILTSATPVMAGSPPQWRVTNYAYTPSGQKSSSDAGTCNAGATAAQITAACANGVTGWLEGGTLKYTYAPDGVNVTQIGRDAGPNVSGPAQISITTRYDQAGNPTRIATSDSTTPVTASYYLDGLTHTAADGTNTNTYAYDANGSLSLRTDQTATGGFTGGALDKTSYNYGESGLPAAGASDVTNTTTAWAYDSAGNNLTRTDTSRVSGTPQVRKITQVFNGDNTVQDLKVEVPGATIADTSYTYDNNGQVTNQNQHHGAITYNYTYGYNPAGNVISWNTGAGTIIGYGWDHNSNRTAVSNITNPASPVVTADAAYNADNSLLTTDSGAGTTTMVYADTYAGEVAATTVSGKALHCTTTAYDAFGRTRIQTSNPSVVNTDTAACGTGAGLTTTTNSYDGLDRVIKTVNTSTATPPTQIGTTTSSYDGLSHQLVGQNAATTGANSNPNSLYQLNPTGAPVAFNQTPAAGGTGTATWLNKDTRGNVTSLNDVGTTNTPCNVEYDPFGGPVNPATSANGVCLAGSTAAGTTANALWYQAGARSNTGTYQDGSRTYNPATASFTTPDNYRAGTPAQDLSVGTDPLTSNTYAYVNGNPINLNDPDGHRAIDSQGHDLSPCVSDPASCNPAAAARAQAEYTAMLRSEAQGEADYNNGVAFNQWLRAARVRALTSNQMFSDPGIAGTTWREATEFGQDDSWGATYSLGLVCFGRPACDAASSYIRDHRGDLTGAIDLAANYCFDHADRCATWMHQATLGRDLLSFAYGAGGGGASAIERAETGLLEGETNFVVRDPLDPGRLITDIDRVEGGVLWEEKVLAQTPMDTKAWIAANVDGKLAKYLEARTYLPKYYADAPVGFSYSTKLAPALQQQIEQRIAELRAANPGVTILTRFTQ